MNVFAIYLFELGVLLEPSVTAHGMEYPALFGQVGSAPTPQLCPFLEFGEN